MHAAAAASFISQPALSKAIQKLEEELGVQLLERRPRGVVPTAYGEVLFRYAKLVEAQLRQATSEIDAMRGQARGTISLGVIPSSSYISSRLAELVTNEHPGLSLKLIADSTTGLLPALADGEIDFALVLSMTGSLPGLVFEPLMRTHTTLVVRKTHPLLGLEKVGLEDLLAYPWMMARFPAEHRACVNRTYLNAGMVPPQPAIEINSIAYFGEALRRTDLIGLASIALINNQTWGEDLVSFEFDFGFPEEIIGLAYREKTVFLPGAATIRDIIRREIGPR